MEADNQSMANQKLEFLNILKEALTLLLEHINFIIFSLFTSLPCFCFSVFFEIVLQKTLFDTYKFLTPNPSEYALYLDSSDSYVIVQNDQISKAKLSVEWIKLCLLYLAPCYLLGLLSIFMTVNAASMIYAGEKPISLRAMMVVKTRLKGPFVTSIYVLLLSTCIIIGLVGIVTNCLILSKGFLDYGYNYEYRYNYESNFFVIVNSLITIFHVAVFIALLIKYSEWSAGWKMALVISVLEEETYGFEAFQGSAYFSRTSTQRGLRLMLVFVVWEILCRLPCLFVGGIMVTSFCTLLICIGNLMKWVVCVVYFFDCKKRILEKKVDEEVGRNVKVANV